MPSIDSARKAAPKTSNPFKAWKEKRAQKKQALAEQAAMEITNDIAENENKIVGVLQGVDFMHSKLPAEVLEAKRKEEHPCGDLEYTTRAIIKTITNHPVQVELDMRQIDEKILILAHMFKDAVNNGEINTAMASQKALLRGVREIRMKVPSNRPELAKLYVETNAKHLESWITLCGFAQQTDALASRVDKDEEMLEAAEAHYEARKAEQAEEIKNNPEYTIAFTNMVENASMEERTKWGPLERDLHLKMVEKRMDGVQLDLQRVKLVQDQQSKDSAMAKLTTLNTKVASLPIVVDPNLMNKFQDEVDDLFKEFAQADVELDETLRAMDDIEGRIQALESAPGAVRAREVAAEEARKALEDIKRQQDEDVGKNKKLADDAMKRLGIRSEEEQAQLKAEFEAAQAAEVDAIMDEEDTVMYN